jgi:hypothetical protein
MGFGKLDISALPGLSRREVASGVDVDEALRDLVSRADELGSGPGAEHLPAESMSAARASREMGCAGSAIDGNVLGEGPGVPARENSVPDCALSR